MEFVLLKGGRMKKIFGFDLGKESMGVCVRDGDKICYSETILIEQEATVEDRRERRRSYRTRVAQKERKQYFNEQWQAAGLDIPSKDILGREFPKKGEYTVCNSALLRIQLLEETRMEPWQVYKALWNAIQKRGYDHDVPWKHRIKDKTEPKQTSKKEKKDDNKNPVDLMNNYNDALTQQIKNNDYHYPCYFSALQMGLWTESDGIVSMHQTNEAKQSKGYTYPRQAITNELKKLLENAKKQYPQLRVSESMFLYGSDDHSNEYQSAKEWKGVLAQKYPRFDNRIISKCKLMPQRNVCRIYPTKKPLTHTEANVPHIYFSILQTLKHIRYCDQDGEKHALTRAQLHGVYNKCASKLKDGSLKNSIAVKDALKSTLKKDGIILHKDESFESIKIRTGGRSSFCRPALIIMIDILKNGKNPLEVDASDYVSNNNTDPKKGTTLDEVRALLAQIGDSWESFHVKDDRDERKEQAQEFPDESIDNLLQCISNPVVRHRLGLFDAKLKALSKEHGTPDYVAIELVRDDNSSFLGKERKKVYNDAQKVNEASKKIAKEKLINADIPDTPTNVLKYRLADELEWKDLITGDAVGVKDLEFYEIEHIVPKSNGVNTDAFYNLTLLKREYNAKGSDNTGKGDQTYYEWFRNDKERWLAFFNRVQALKSLSKKKKNLLLSHDARVALDSYNPLADTAYVSKLAQYVACFRFGWGLQTKGDAKRVFTSNGSLTHKIRQRYRLDDLLVEEDAICIEKNRSNPKHHAMDAMCVSFANDYMTYQHPHSGKQISGIRDSATPSTCIRHDVFKTKIQHALSETVVTKYGRDNSGLMLEEAFYGKRSNNKKEDILTKNVPLIGANINKIVDVTIKNDLISKYTSAKTYKKEWGDYRHPFFKNIVKRVRIEVASVEKNDNGEFKDVGKPHQTREQYKKGKTHRGQIIYFDKKGKSRVQPIYAHTSPSVVIQQLEDDGVTCYKNGVMFYSGQKVKIERQFKARRLVDEKKIYIKKDDILANSGLTDETLNRLIKPQKNKEDDGNSKNYIFLPTRDSRYYQLIDYTQTDRNRYIEDVLHKDTAATLITFLYDYIERKECDFEPGDYFVNTIKTSGTTKLTTMNGVRLSANISVLVEAGIQPIQP